MTTAVAGITEKQASYIRSLVATVRPDVPVDEGGLASLSRKEASVMIDSLLALKAQKASAGYSVAHDAGVSEAEANHIVTAPAPVEFSLAEGYYTVQFGELYDGEETHRTFRVKDASAQSKLAGKRIISLLSGPDNESDYMGVGFVTGEGVSVWKRFSAESVMRDAIDILLGDPEMAQKGYALHSGNCYVCGRLLTDPISIELGIGPVCREG